MRMRRQLMRRKQFGMLMLLPKKKLRHLGSLRTSQALLKGPHFGSVSVFLFQKRKFLLSAAV